MPERGDMFRKLTGPFATTRRRLILINLGVVAAIVAVMATAIYATDAHAVDQQIDQQLLSWSKRDDVQSVFLGNAASEIGGSDPADQYEPTTPNIFTIFCDTHGKIIADPGNAAKFGLPDRAAVANALTGKHPATLQTVTAAGHHFRLYTTPVRRADGALAGAIQVGTSLDARDRQLGDLLATLGIVGAGMLILAVGASLLLANFALVPARLAFGRQRQFAAAASHELRTPLALVRSQAELLTRRLQRHPDANVVELATDAEDIVAETDFMVRLVRDLLLLARDPADSRALRHQSIALNDLAGDVIKKLEPLATAKDIVLTAHMPATSDQAVWVNGDADRMRQLFVILLDNAIKYTPAGGSVTCSLRTEAGAHLLVGHGGRAVVEIADTGCGITPEDQERVFEPFYRADHARTAATEQHSVGLGLSLARWIASAHGGTISLHSQLGQGSTFTVTLPLAVAPSHEAHS